MNIKFLKYIVCPTCNGELILQSGNEETIILNDNLICKLCKKIYPIIDGIPRLIDKLGTMKTTKESFSEEWKFRSYEKKKKKLSSGYSKEDRYKKVLEKLDVNKNNLKQKLILDAGSGDGEYGSENAKNNPKK